MTPRTQAAWDNITGTCGGADNGKFVSLMMGIRAMDAENSEAAEKVLDIMHRFSSLIDKFYELQQGGKN